MTKFSVNNKTFVKEYLTHKIATTSKNHELQDIWMEFLQGSNFFLWMHIQYFFKKVYHIKYADRGIFRTQSSNYDGVF